MQDHLARELKGHNILSVERFWDDTRYMIEFVIRRRRNPYGSQGDEIRLFLNEHDFQIALKHQKRQEIRIRRIAHIVEGHILDDDLKKYK